MYFLFFVCFCFCEIVQVNIVSRHCDRTPTSFLVFPNFPINIFGELNQTIGKLTALGETQCFQIGEKLKSRYIDDSSQYKIHDISTFYNSLDYYFQSTNVQRSMRSLTSIGLGLFPNGHRRIVDVGTEQGNYPIPDGVQTIPVHTIQTPHDRFLLGYESGKCPTLWEKYKEYYESAEGLELTKPYSDFLDEIHTVLGEELSDEYFEFSTFFHVFDLLNVLNEHDRYPTELLPYWDKAKNISDLSFSLLFGREISGNLGGSEIIQEIINNQNLLISSSSSSSSFLFDEELFPWGGPMNDFLSGANHKESSTLRRLLEEDVDENYPEQSFRKYIHYSSHDSTLQSIFSSLDLPDRYPNDFFGVMNYGSYLVFELHKVDDSYYVKFLYQNGFDGELKAYSLGDVCGETTMCPLPQFIKFCEKVAISSNWCEECGNTDVTDICMKKAIGILEGEKDVDQITLSILALGLGSALAFCLMFIVALLVICCSLTDWKKVKRFFRRKTSPIYNRLDLESLVEEDEDEEKSAMRRKENDGNGSNHEMEEMEIGRPQRNSKIRKENLRELEELANSLEKEQKVKKRKEKEKKEEILLPEDNEDDDDEEEGEVDEILD